MLLVLRPLKLQCTMPRNVHHYFAFLSFSKNQAVSSWINQALYAYDKEKPQNHFLITFCNYLENFTIKLIEASLLNQITDRIWESKPNFAVLKINHLDLSCNSHILNPSSKHTSDDWKKIIDWFVHFIIWSVKTRCWDTKNSIT